MRLPRRRPGRSDVDPGPVTTTYCAVYLDGGDPVDAPVGLYRRTVDPTGRVTATEAFHPRTGWRHTDHWHRVAWGEPDDHLVEVDEGRALVIRDWFVALHAGPDEPQA